MKVYIEAWINDSAHEYLLNLVAQGFYSESWELKMKLLTAFDDSLMYIMGNTLNEELKTLSKQIRNNR